MKKREKYITNCKRKPKQRIMNIDDFASNYSTLFKYRKDLSNEHRIVLYRVYSRGFLNRYVSMITSHIEQMFTTYIYFVQVTAKDPSVIGEIEHDLKFMGRVSPEELCNYLSKHKYKFDIEPHTMEESEWCYSKGVVRDVTKHGCKICIAKT